MKPINPEDVRPRRLHVSEREVRKALLAVVTHVKERTKSWDALNPQVAWAINDRILTELDAGQHYDLNTLVDLRFTMQADGQWPLAEYWQHFWMAPDALQRTIVRQAAAQLDLTVRP